MCPGHDRRSRVQIFEDSQAAITRLRVDPSGLRQDIARRGIKVAETGMLGGGAQVQILRVPGHTGVPGNELADEWVVDAARRESKEKGPSRENMGRSQFGLLKAERKKDTVREWREEVIRRCRGS